MFLSVLVWVAVAAPLAADAADVHKAAVAAAKTRHDRTPRLDIVVRVVKTIKGKTPDADATRESTDRYSLDGSLARSEVELWMRGAMPANGNVATKQVEVRTGAGLREFYPAGLDGVGDPLGVIVRERERFHWSEAWPLALTFRGDDPELSPYSLDQFVATGRTREVGGAACVEFERRSERQPEGGVDATLARPRRRVRRQAQEPRSRRQRVRRDRSRIPPRRRLRPGAGQVDANRDARAARPAPDRGGGNRGDRSRVDDRRRRRLRRPLRPAVPGRMSGPESGRAEGIPRRRRRHAAPRAAQVDADEAESGAAWWGRNWDLVAVAATATAFGAVIVVAVRRRRAKSA